MQFLHAFFRRGAPRVTGSHASGRSRSAAVKRLSASNAGADGAESVQRAFLDAFFSGLAGRRSATEVLRETEMPEVCTGFWATIEPFSVAFRTVNPARVRSEGSVGSADERFRRYSVPRGWRPVRSCARSSGIFDERPSYSDGESVTCAAEKVDGCSVDAKRD